MDMIILVITILMLLITLMMLALCILYFIGANIIPGLIKMAKLIKIRINY
jgi:hypothetical protein